MAIASNVLKPTIRQLSNKDIRIRRRAVRKLFELDDPAAIDAFIPMLNDKDEWFRGKALMAIQRWASMKELDLAEKLSVSPKSEERILACRIAPKVGKSSKKILQNMLNDEEHLVKQNAWKNILNLDEKYIHEAIMNEDVGIRALGIEKLDEKDDINSELLINLFDDESTRIRKKAIKLLRKRPDLYDSGELDEAIIKVAEDDKNIQIDALIMLIESGRENNLLARKIPDWLENENPESIGLLVEAIKIREWEDIDWLISLIMKSSNENLISRILRRENSILANQYKIEILLDEERKPALRSRIIEDLFGKKQNDEITKIIYKLESNQDESISQTARMFRESTP